MSGLAARAGAAVPHVLVRVSGRVASAFRHDRRLARSPLWFYRRGLGSVLGDRLLMLEHRGRTSGLTRQVCLEVVDRPAPGTSRVPQAQVGPALEGYAERKPAGWRVLENGIPAGRG